MSQLIQRSATLIDCHYVANHIRAEDRAEVASLGKTPLDSILQGYIYGDKKWALLIEDEPIAICGTVPITKDIGAIWLLGTDKLFTHKVAFIRRNKELLSAASAGYEMLCNIVDSRNELHIRWLRWLGFSFIRSTTERSVDGTPFYEFAKLTHV